MLLSCSNKINVFKTGTSSIKNFTDTIPYDKNNKFIVISTRVDNTIYNLMFDTGADFVTLPQNKNLKQTIKCKMKDANGCTNDVDLIPISSIKISNNNIQHIYGLNLALPAPFQCFCDGIIGNNIVKFCNWSIEKNDIIISSRSFDAVNKKLEINIFYCNSNRLCSNIQINNCKVDTCYFDYGDSNGDISLSQNFYDKNKIWFKPNKITKIITTAYGANGNSEPDTIMQLNCNTNFNGVEIDSVNIDIKKNGENRIGLKFLKRFKRVIINNTSNKMIFGSLDKDFNKYQNDLPVLFDFIDNFFVVKRKVINNNCANLNIGDVFVEINSVKGSDIKSYCDFLKFSNSLQNVETLELKTEDNKKIIINNTPTRTNFNPY